MSNIAQAGDLGREIRSGTMAPDNQNGGYFSLGVGIGVVQHTIYGYPEDNQDDDGLSGIAYLNLNGRYQYNNWFIEAYSESVHDFNMGYTLLDDDKWSVDFILSPSFSYLGEDSSDDWKELKERDGDLGAGFRVNHYTPDYILQFRLLSDISGTHGGQNASAFIGKNWQIRNWNFHSLVGVTYNSADALDYYFGIEESEVSDEFSRFDASGGLDLTIELGLAYPISEDWVFRAGYRYMRLPNEIADSPLILRQDFQLLATSINYVF
jgi:outer membrane scaffolding protein for murein synthesis (MipA/OmpV family)